MVKERKGQGFILPYGKFVLLILLSSAGESGGELYGGGNGIFLQ